MTARRLFFASIVVASVVVVAVVLAAESYPGKLDARVARHIEKLCGDRNDCQVYLRDLTKDDWITDASWDRYFEFGPSTTNEEISKTIGTPFAMEHDLKRVIVLMRDHTIVYSEVAEEGIEMPLRGEVVLACRPFDGPFTSCAGNALLKVKRVRTSGDAARLFSRSGSAYFLTQIN
jgi:hypothetical protein